MNYRRLFQWIQIYLVLISVGNCHLDCKKLVKLAFAVKSRHSTLLVVCTTRIQLDSSNNLSCYRCSLRLLISNFTAVSRFPFWIFPHFSSAVGHPGVCCHISSHRSHHEQEADKCHELEIIAIQYVLTNKKHISTQSKNSALKHKW